MPPDKSHTDEKALANNRTPWQRSHTHPTDFHTPKKTLAPVSAVTRNKLSFFQYQPRQRGPSKENDGLDAADGKKKPKSPATRLLWQEPEESSDSSPHEKLLWDNKVDYVYSDMTRRMMQQKRKRAKSSSPTSSPSIEITTPPISKHNRAPRAAPVDSVTAAWDRYAMASGESPTEARRLARATFTTSTSPKKPAAKDSDNILRRTSSCGLPLPKRRRSARSFDMGADFGGRTKAEMVDALLETAKIWRRERNVETPVREPKRNKKKTPSPSRRAAPEADSGSPTDYDDGTFDDDSLAELEQSMRADPKSSLFVPLETPSKRKRQPPAPIDEFLDMDDDIFDDAEQLLSVSNLPKNGAASYRSPRKAMAPRKMTTPRKTMLSRKALTPRNKKSRQGVAQSPSDEFEDDFDGDIDFDALELAATQSVKHRKAPPVRVPGSMCTMDKQTPPPRYTKLTLSQSSDKPKTIQRYLITGVFEGEYTDEKGQGRLEKILIIQGDNSKTTKTVHLRGAWLETPAHEKAYVHVIGDFSARGQCIVDDAHNLLILHPDQLISATVVADSFGCMRRAVLQDRVKATSDLSPPLVYGTMLHEIFQDAMLANRWDLEFLAGVIDGIIDKHVEDLYVIKVGVAAAREHLQSKMTELSQWAKAFVSVRPKAQAVVEDRNGKKATMAITKLLDVEEHVWSPMYGLKGNIDATVEVVMADGGQQRRLTVPFEVKTGRNANSSHMAQTALYTLLLSDRYDIDIACGILYYMETSKTLRIPAVRHELRHMIMQRNQLACHVRERSVQLPPMLKSAHMCGRCYANTTCFIYHRLADGGDGITSGLGDKFDAAVAHLTPTHRDFFLKWEQLLTLEEKEGHKTKRELWTMTSQEREKKARCFANVVMEPGSAREQHDVAAAGASRINRFHYTFVRLAGAGGSFLDSELTVGEPVVVSDEQGHFALAIGFVTAVRTQRISVAVDRRLHNARIRQPGFDERDNQVFASIMDVAAPRGRDGSSSGGRGAPSRHDDTSSSTPPVRYRLDQDEFSNGMATVRNNLVQLMANAVPAAPKLRSLIVDLTPPRFRAPCTTSPPPPHDDSPAAHGATSERLNMDQQRAVDKVMSAQDYALVLGMPGTGKTTTIAHIIRALVAQGKSVLLASHTHTAVDNILLKLRHDKTPILRLGAPAKVHPDVSEFAHLGGEARTSFAAIDEAWHGTPVVATTCLGINHALLSQRAFDYCIVDEASQITLPICAGPIRLAAAFVLVGDHNQLPPVVRNEGARDGGLDVSLFKLLSDAHPQAVVHLEHQYRMCEDIMALSNTLIYNGRLRCGFDALRLRSLDVPDMPALARLHHHDAASLSRVLSPQSSPPSSRADPASSCSVPPSSLPRTICPGPAPAQCWLHDALSPTARVRFLNTDTLHPPAREASHGKRITNPSEARLIAHLVTALITVGVAPSSIGVMTHYRAQLSLLRHLLRAHAPALEMHTTDRFQGRDKEVVLLSLVRANDSGAIGDLLRDWRRINVALTRAKTKLLVVGSAATLGRERERDGQPDMLARFVALMQSRHWVYALPPHALECHAGVDAAAAPDSQLSLPGVPGVSGLPGVSGVSGVGVVPSVSNVRPLAYKTSTVPNNNNNKTGRKSAVAPGKENQRPGPRRATAGGRVLLRDRLITRDILNEMTDGAFS